MSTLEVIHGDCATVLPTFAGCRFDSIVTDPPAGIGFMAKEWDHHKGGRDSWIAWMQAIAAECLRVVKPGAHALVWAIPRTSHWTATAWENAGWEVRDCIEFIFGTGFPKSTRPAQGLGTALKPSHETWLLLRKPMAVDDNFAILIDNLTRRIEACKGTCSRAATSESMSAEDAIVLSTISSWRNILAALYVVAKTSTTSMETRATTDSKILNSCLLEITPADIIRARCCPSGAQSSVSNAAERFDALLASLQDILMPSALRDATRAALSLKASAGALPLGEDGASAELSPSQAKIWLLRKPLVGTVAANVQTFGTGAMRIDECRIATEEVGGSRESSSRADRENWRIAGGSTGSGAANSLGRWPANLLHDGSPEVVGMFPESYDGVAVQRNGGGRSGGVVAFHSAAGGAIPDVGYGGSGSAARFFFSGKATRADREEGLADFEAKQQDDGRESDAPGANNPRNRGGQARRNNHPTVKATSLMRWLCRLITPAGGTVLDPFAGSGSTGKACAFERLGFVGIEQDADYVAIARSRIAWAEAHRGAEQLSLLEQEI